MKANISRQGIRTLEHLAGLSLRSRTVALLFAAVAAVAIGASRLALGAHSFAEVALGGAAGLLGAFGMLLLAGRRPSGLDARRIVVIAVLVAVLFHGLHLRAEAQIRFAAWKISRVLAVCQSDDVRL